MPYITEEQWKTLIYYAKRQFVYDLLLGNLQNVKAIWERMDSINISVMPKVAIALRLDNYYALTSDKSERWKHQFREKIWTYLENLLPEWVLGVPFAENLIALLLPLRTSTYTENRAELIHLIAPWSENIVEQFGIKVIWGVGCVYNDPRLLHFSFQESVRILDHPEKYGHDICFADPPCASGYEEVPQNDTDLKEETADPVQRWPEWAKNRVVRKLEMVDCPGVILELKDVVDKQLRKFQSDDRNRFAPVIALELAMAIAQDIITDGSLNVIYAEIADYLASPAAVDCQKWLEQFGENLIHWSKANGFSENPYIGRVKAYVEDHLDEELSLSHIAEIVHLTPSYLSQLFKKKTGEGLNDFIVKSRINKACRLLQTLPLPVSDIARKVGFQDVNYFTRVFKQRQHLTPLEFRKGAKQT